MADSLMLETVQEVQKVILAVAKYIDELCRSRGITYYIMGGTALGAVRHGGFIPWDDDLDIFMTPDQYEQFSDAFREDGDPRFVLQEWRTTPDYLEYAKVRMNGTTFIESAFKSRKDLHQGIYVDIMILHKVPKNRIIQKKVYYKSKFVTLYALSQRGWKPKNSFQRLALAALKVLPSGFLAASFYDHIYKYDHMDAGFMYCYWITPAGFSNGLFEESMFSNPVDVPFEDTALLGSADICKYLQYRYGDYMKLPPEEARRAAVHAEIFDTKKDYTYYLE